jgi:hypothetical protein
VAGAPVNAFGLPRLGVRKQLASDIEAPRPADLAHPLLREGLDVLPSSRSWAAAFETRIWWSVRGATGTIESKLRQAGYAKVTRAERFIAAGAYGPLRESELARARLWCAHLTARTMERLAASSSLGDGFQPRTHRRAGNPYVTPWHAANRS